MVRNILALVVGFLVLFSVVTSILAVGSLLFPPPAGLDLATPDPAALEEYTATLPPAGWLLPLLGEVLGAFLGAWTAGSLAASHSVRFAGAIVGLAVAGSLMNWFAFPHPTWFVVGQLVAYPLAFWAAARLLRRRNGSAPAATPSDAVA